MEVRAESARADPWRQKLTAQCPEYIECDPTRLKQILVNLVGNAIKFTEGGGVRMVTRSFHDDGDAPQLEISVIDTGIGMSPEQVAVLFKPFTQADTTMTRRFGGTGLGLSISSRLAGLLGGSISIDSQIGRGTTFTLQIAARPLEGTRMITAMREACGVSRASEVRKTTRRIDCRLLLAEDGPDNQRLISFLLKKAGAEVTLAENGRIAVETAMAARADGLPFDIILMDMQMPELDGYGATRELRDRGWDGPIVALTAHAMAEDRAKCIAAGCDDFATKPIDRHVLLDVLYQNLHQGDSLADGSA